MPQDASRCHGVYLLSVIVTNKQVGTLASVIKFIYKAYNLFYLNIHIGLKCRKQSIISISFIYIYIII